MTATSSSGDAPDELGVVLVPSLSGTEVVAGALDHVGVGEDQPVGVDDHARAGAAEQARLGCRSGCVTTDGWAMSRILWMSSAVDRRCRGWSRCRRSSSSTTAPATDEAGADHRSHDAAPTTAALAASGRRRRPARAAVAWARSPAARGATPAGGPVRCTGARRRRHGRGGGGGTLRRSAARSAAARGRAAGSRSAPPVAAGRARPDAGPGTPLR